MTEVILPYGPNAIFATVEPIFSRFFGAENYQLGGGTALAAMWAHRHSTDIDFFIDQRHFQSVMHDSDAKTSLKNVLADSTEIRFADINMGFIRGVTQLGDEFSLMTTPRLLSIESKYRVVDTQVFLEDPAEILAKKIRYRMIGNGILVARDLFDIAAAYEIAPQALISALNTINLDESLDIARELRTLPKQWVSGGESGRELLNPQYPQWLAANPKQLLPWAERLFRNGPELVQAQLEAGQPPPNPDRLED